MSTNSRSIPLATCLSVSDAADGGNDEDGDAMDRRPALSLIELRESSRSASTSVLLSSVDEHAAHFMHRYVAR